MWWTEFSCDHHYDRVVIPCWNLWGFFISQGNDAHVLHPGVPHQPAHDHAPFLVYMLWHCRYHLLVLETHLSCSHSIWEWSEVLGANPAVSFRCSRPVEAFIYHELNMIVVTWYVRELQLQTMYYSHLTWASPPRTKNQTRIADGKGNLAGGHCCISPCVTVVSAHSSSTPALSFICYLRVPWSPAYSHWSAQQISRKLLTDHFVRVSFWAPNVL